MIKIEDIGQNRSYHNNWSPYIHHKRTTVKLKYKSFASKNKMTKKKKPNRSHHNNDLTFPWSKKHDNYIVCNLSKIKKNE